MTKEMLNVNSKGEIYFDCHGHAGETDICAMISTLCNVLIVACKDYGKTPKTEEDGHLTFDIADAPAELIQLFKWVQTVLNELESQFPEYLRIY